MRSAVVFLLAAAFGILVAVPASAGTLDTRHCEWAFDMNYTNQSGAGSATNLNLAWGYLFGQGYSELGLDGTYQKVEDKISGSSTTSLSIVGLFYTWNWTPHAERATGFLTVGAGGIGGDLSNYYDYSLDAALGVKLFTGHTAAVTARYFYQRLQHGPLYSKGTNYYSSAGGEDLSGIAIGISLYSNHKSPAPRSGVELDD